jgi:two-component system sensor histidine kinase KdpD
MKTACMEAPESDRPDPDELLARVQSEERSQRRGHLKIWFGACPGVGKTFSMLSAAQRLRARGTDVVVGLVETHGRAETERLVRGLEQVPRRVVEYRGTRLSEFDLEAALARRPAVLLLDELAHTNAPGSRFAKRWQDVRALLDAQIDVHTTLNVQHLESLNDVVARITGVEVRETVPDHVLDEAEEIEIVDLAPDALLERLRAGKVYLPEAASRAADAFFKKGNLAALRELALRKTAQWVDQRRREERLPRGGRHLRSTSERILVCVGPSPFSARLVRAAHRNAVVLRGELFALHVARPAGRRVSPADHERVLHNLRIAESLGARVASVESGNPAEAVVAFAASHEISRVVVGRTGRTRMHELVFGSFTMDVIRTCGCDVYVIRDDTEEAIPSKVKAPPARPRIRTRDMLGALACTGAASAITLWCYAPPDLSVEALVLALGVVVTAQRFGRWPAVFAAVLSALAFNFLLTEPRFTFTIADPAYLLAFGVMMFVALSIGSLVAAVKERAEAASGREREVTALHSFSRELADAQTVEEVGRVTIAHLRDVVRAGIVMIVPVAPDSIGTAGVIASHGGIDWLVPDVLAVARWCWEHGAAAGIGTRNLPGTGALFLPVRSSRGREAVLGLRPREADGAPDAKQRLLLDTFVEQAALAFERLEMAEERHRVRREAEVERLRSNLLASVSHDLRTPLATITGSASGLLDDALTDPVVRRELLAGIASEAKRLNDLIANLVFATRLEAGHMSLKREWTSVEELVGSALQRANDHLAGHPTVVDVGRDLPLVEADPVLLEQAIFLLLDNAARHTPPGTRVGVRARSEGREVVIEVADDGPGVPDRLRTRLFHRFERGESSAGMGLGLSICAAILKAHGGQVSLVPSADHGSVFSMRVPTPREQPTVRASENGDEAERDHG